METLNYLNALLAIKNALIAQDLLILIAFRATTLIFLSITNALKHVPWEAILIFKHFNALRALFSVKRARVLYKLTV
jgi:hypothetical protein